MNLTAEYVLWVFGASCGVLQIAAVHSRLRGMSFFARPLWGYLFGSLAIAGSFWWFFGTSDRSAVDFPYQTPQQTQIGYVALALLAALLFTLAISSGLKHNQLDNSAKVEEGLEALRQRTYSQIIRHLFRRMKPE